MTVNWNEIIDPSWTLFLDRDGVINKRIVGGYVTDCASFEFLPGVLDALRTFARRFNHIVLVTNQQGVGKGLMTETQLEAVHDAMMNRIEAEGGRIDVILCCTQLASDPDNYRKPKPDMAFMAQDIFPDIDMSKSIMVGDSPTDVAFGINAGMHTVFVGARHPDSDDCFASLYEFSKSLEA